MVITIAHWHVCANIHPSGEVVSTVIIFSSLWSPLLTRLKWHGLHVTCALIRTSHKLAAYNYTGSRWTRAGGCKELSQWLCNYQWPTKTPPWSRSCAEPNVWFWCPNSPWCWSYEYCCHCSSAHFYCHQKHSSQERPMKILALPLWLLSCTDAYPGSEVVSEVIIWASFWHPRYSFLRQLVEVHMSCSFWPSTTDTPGWCR